MCVVVLNECLKMHQRFMDMEEISRSEVELLEAAGYIDVAAFGDFSTQEIYDELERANQMLSIVDEVPSLERIATWRRNAGGESYGVGAAASSSLDESELLREDEEAELPFAQPLSRKFVAKHHIDIESLPQLVEGGSLRKPKAKAVIPDGKKDLVETVPGKRKGEIEVQKLRSIDDARNEKVSKSALPVKNGEVDRTKVVSPETNEGVDPHSRNYVRGVLHNDPIGTSFGAYAFVLTSLLLVASLVPIGYILFHRDEYMWGLLSPALFIVAMMIYLGSARKTACPVCRQRQFVPKSCLKHNKAHHIRGLGHMLPTAIHLICFHWFRCIFCGTSIRVKE